LEVPFLFLLVFSVFVMPIPSPCIGVCTVAADGTCEGCLRTLDEIGRWSVASDAEKLAILDATIERATASRLPPEVIRARLDSLCKPPGSLGELERLAFELCRIQNTLTPVSQPRRLVVFAADHGVAAQRVTAWPSEVTSMVVGVMAKRRSASGVMSRACKTDYRVVDVGCLQPPKVPTGHSEGVDSIFCSHPVAAGTKDLSSGPAMSRTQFHAAWRVGTAQADDAANEQYAVVAGGEMGIGNTTSASCLVTLLTGLSPEQSVGRGAGVNDEGLAIKRAIVTQATSRAKPWIEKEDWKGVACEVGGFEIVAMSAFFVRAAQRRLVIVLDGFIATAAALLAERMYPGTARSMIASHLSSEPGHMKALESLGLVPFLDWKLRLGEGTGAIMLMPMLDTAVVMVTQMATLDDVT
jgi:nicotinate-nucleotide--dimethylbenzimidazole phosphoribosyltransferase